MTWWSITRSRSAKEHGSEGNFVRSETIPEFLAALEKPRRAIIMVKAGAPVDAVIEQLIPLLEPGDIIIDGGNSLWTDTQRREKYLKEKGIHFFGVGVSGGEEGALKGPSIMPGGSTEGWKSLAPIYTRSPPWWKASRAAATWARTAPATT